MLAVLEDGPQLCATLRSEEQRLCARAHDPVAALELAAIHREVGLMNELVGVEPILREACDAERHGGADRLRCRLHLELPLCDGTADSFCDLQRLLGRGLRQEDRELFAAEARRHVVVPELGAEDLGDPLEDGVARQVAVAVVDIPQEVEVGHDQRHRPLEASCACDLGGEGGREVARVVQARLRVDARLRLELRHAERPVHDDERRERREDEPGIPVPERRQRNPEDRQHQVDRDRLDTEEAALAEAVPAAELQDHRDDDVVHRDEHDARGEPGDGEARLWVRDRARAVPADQLCRTPRRQRVERVVRDVEALNRPRVALLQPLRDGLDEWDQDDQLRREQERRRDEEDDGRVVHHVPRRLDRERVRDRRCGGEHDERNPPVVHVRHAEVELAGGCGGGESEERQIDLRAPREPAPGDRVPGHPRRLVDHPSRHGLGNCAHRIVSVRTETAGRRAMPPLSERRLPEASPVRIICTAWLQRTAGPVKGPAGDSG